MELGRKIYFNNQTGKILMETGELVGGHVTSTSYEDDIAQEALKDIEKSIISMIELPFGFRRDEILRKGSWSIDLVTNNLIIYPNLNITVDGVDIITNQIATISVTTKEDCIVNFQVNDQAFIPKDTVNNQAIFTFQSDVPGTYTITANTELYGAGIVEVIVNA